MSRWFGGTSVTSLWPMRMASAGTSSSPAIQRRSVVFPQPDGPTSTMNSPSSIVRSTPSTARTPFGNTLTTVSSSMPATYLSLQPGGHDAAGEPLLQDEECEDRRQREEQGTREDRGHQQVLRRRVVVARCDLDAERAEPVGEEQRRIDVLPPPA